MRPVASERNQGQGAEASHPVKGAVGREHFESVTDAKLSEKDINRPDLEPLSTTGVPELCRFNVIRTLGDDEGKKRESLDDPVSCFRTAKALEELLKDQARREEKLARLDCLPQEFDLGGGRPLISSQSERPDTCVHEYVQRLRRSAL